MKKNTYDKAADANNGPKKDINLTEAGGVYDRSPDPGFSEYKHSMGPNTIPVKFQEAQPVSRAPANTVMGANGKASGEKPKIPTTSRVNKSKNTYDGAVDMKKGRVGHY